MPSILFIADHRLNRSPSQRYRFEQYLNYFETQGYQWELSEIINEKDDKVFYGSGNILKKAWILFKSLFIRWKDLRRAQNFDLIFIQREALLLGSSYFEKRFYKNNKVIFDFDDSIWLLDTSPGNKKYEFLKNPDKTKINIQHAHAVIAGNRFLADYAKQFNSNVFLIPTTIDTDFHKPNRTQITQIDKMNYDEKSVNNHNNQRRQRSIIIGWSGSISTIKHFEIAIPALKKLVEKYPGQLEIHVIGQGNYQHPELPIISKNWSSDEEVSNLSQFDIGIMPLPNDEWVKGKCGLKGLSYMACGVATVMSNVGVNPEIIVHGVNGYLATSETDWVTYLSELIENRDLRQKFAEAGRKTVVEKYSVQSNKQRYLEAFKSLIKE